MLNILVGLCTPQWASRQIYRCPSHNQRRPLPNEQRHRNSL